MAKETTTRPHIIIIKEIADKLEAIRQNRSQKNESTPIYQLPPEVLEIVFTLAIAECNQDPDCEKLPPPIWFNFACVSQRWRNVALNTSRIWGVLLLGHPKWATVSLERSKEADLAIILNWNPTTSNDSISLMKKVFENHVSRIRNVHLSVNGFKKLHLGLYSFLGNLEDNSLSLHSFRLIVQNTVYIRFPVRIFSDTSRMRNLHIYNCYAKWPLSFPNLTRLRIHYSPNWDSSLDDFLTTLRGMPELRVLDLDNSFPRFMTRPTTPVPVAFPKLRSLDLHSRARVDELPYFLPFLDIPSTTTIRLSSEGSSHFHDIRIRSMSTFLSRDFATVSFESLRVYCPGRSFIVEIWKSETGISSTQILRLIWTIPMTIEPPWPSYDLITLILHIHISTEELIQLFGHLPLLRSIVVSGPTVFNVISALSPNKPQNCDILRSASYSVTFPALRSLSIRTVDYTAGSMPDKEVDLMLNCFMERRQRNASLEELEILQCKCIRESHVNLLRQVVVNVRWDKDGMEDSQPL